MDMKNRFVRSGGGVFQCCSCGRSTRLTDQGCTDSRCCSECWALAGIDNSVNDGVEPWAEVEAECDRLLAEAVKKGGDAKLIKADFHYLWPKP
jgi:hypothetical protein